MRLPRQVSPRSLRTDMATVIQLPQHKRRQRTPRHATGTLLVIPSNPEPVDRDDLRFRVWQLVKLDEIGADISGQLANLERLREEWISQTRSTDPRVEGTWVLVHPNCLPEGCSHPAPRCSICPGAGSTITATVRKVYASYADKAKWERLNQIEQCLRVQLRRLEANRQEYFRDMESMMQRLAAGAALIGDKIGVARSDSDPAC